MNQPRCEMSCSWLVAGLLPSLALSATLLACSSSKSTTEVTVTEVQKPEPSTAIVDLERRAVIEKRTCPNPLVWTDDLRSKKTSAAELLAADKSRYQLVGFEEFASIALDDDGATLIHIAMDDLKEIDERGSFEFAGRVVCHTQVQESTPGSTINNNLDASAADWVALASDTMGPVRHIHFNLDNGEASWTTEVKPATAGLTFGSIDEAADDVDEMDIFLSRSGTDRFHIHLHLRMATPAMEVWMRADYQRVP